MYRGGADEQAERNVRHRNAWSEKVCLQSSMPPGRRQAERPPCICLCARGFCEPAYPPGRLLLRHCGTCGGVSPPLFSEKGGIAGAARRPHGSCVIPPGDTRSPLDKADKAMLRSPGNAPTGHSARNQDHVLKEARRPWPRLRTAHLRRQRGLGSEPARPYRLTIPSGPQANRLTKCRRIVAHISRAPGGQATVCAPSAQKQAAAHVEPRQNQMLDGSPTGQGLLQHVMLPSGRLPTTVEAGRRSATTPLEASPPQSLACARRLPRTPVSLGCALLQPAVCKDSLCLLELAEALSVAGMLGRAGRHHC